MLSNSSLAAVRMEARRSTSDLLPPGLGGRGSSLPGLRDRALYAIAPSGRAGGANGSETGPPSGAMTPDGWAAPGGPWGYGHVGGGSQLLDAGGDMLLNPAVMAAIAGGRNAFARSSAFSAFCAGRFYRDNTIMAATKRKALAERRKELLDERERERRRRFEVRINEGRPRSLP